ncbi:hypothetical protein [Pseudomonas sp. Irchel s3b5]|uniref:hypothetical protein n=1 Tax=Pseudomonas sp. Irchel s3b5 TaxID=2009077 RepID=UPI000BA470B0|nr:hypothetical protein [Pseudomonas sp. Irchel s3b5]
MDDVVYAEKLVAEFKARPGGKLYAALFSILDKHGLKPHGSANSKTLLYKYAGTGGEQHNLLAFRREPIRVVSFPKGFWQERKSKRSELCAEFDPILEMPTVGPGGGPSVKESAGQVSLNDGTLERLKALCEAVCLYAKSLEN